MLFLMIGSVFLGIGPVGWLGRHIRMDVIVSPLPPRARKFFEIFSDLVTIATCVMLAIFAWPVMTMLAELDQRSETANFPMVIPQAVVPLGLVLMALLIARAAHRAWRAPRRRDLEPRSRALKCRRRSSISSCRRCC